MTLQRFIPAFALAVLSLAGLSSCYYDVEEELYPISICDTTNISFSLDVLPIFNQSQCNVCHATGIALGAVIMDTHTEVKKKVDDGRLIGALRHESGFSPMPQGQAKLDACTIAKITAWVDAGAPNN